MYWSDVGNFPVLRKNTRLKRFVKYDGDNGMEIYEHCLITFIGQPFGPVDFSDFSLVITLHTMEGEIAISSI